MNLNSVDTNNHRNDINSIPDIKNSTYSTQAAIESVLFIVFEGLSHPDVIRYYGVSYKTIDDTKAQMKFFADLEKEGTGICWAICSLDNKMFYGAGGLNSLSKKHRKAEVGFWLLNNFWRQGIITEAMPLICQYSFDKLKLHRIEGFVETENVNSKKAMNRLAFTHEGTIRNCGNKKWKIYKFGYLRKTHNG